MKSFLIAVIFLLIGLAAGGFLALGLGAGMGAGAGILVGTQAGACLAFEAAKEQGLLTREEIDQTIKHAVQKIKGKSAPETDGKMQWVDSEADCAKIIAEMEKAAQTK